jgi:hypothetical protein
MQDTEQGELIKNSISTQSNPAQTAGINQIAYRDKRVHNLGIDSFIIFFIFWFLLSIIFSLNVFDARQFTLREYLVLYIVVFLYYFLFEFFFKKLLVNLLQKQT